MSNPVRIGVIGASEFTANMHLSCLASDPQTQIAAICARSRTNTEALAARFNIPEIYQDYREMFARAKLDAVLVSIPDDLHYPVVMAALDAGLHVLCEKPLASTAAQALEMTEKAAAAGRVNCTYFTFRWFPHFRYLKELFEQQAIGRVFHAQIRYLFDYARNPAYAWRFDPARAGGVVADLGAHAFDQARWYFGEITSVFANLHSIHPHYWPDGRPVAPSNDLAHVELRFASGMSADITLTAGAVMSDKNYEIQILALGDGGTLEVAQSMQGSDENHIVTPLEMRISRAGQDHFENLHLPANYCPSSDPANAYSVFTNCDAGARAFTSAIRRGQPATPSFEDGYQAQRVIDAAIRSHQSGGWENV